MLIFVVLLLSFDQAFLEPTSAPAGAYLVRGSGQESSHDAVHDEFFSGSVQEVSETSVTVSRSLPGKPPETRSFVLGSDTIIEGRLKKLARVTVGYRTQDGVDHAWRIIVRENPE